MMSNPLVDVIPPAARKYVYALAFLVGLGFTAYAASDGNWLRAVALFVGSLVPLLAASNTPLPLKAEPIGKARLASLFDVKLDKLTKDD